MRYQIKFKPVFTTNSDTAISLSKKGYRLRSVAYFVNETGNYSYSFVRTHL